MTLCDPATGSHLEYGNIGAAGSEKPVWWLDQWSSRFKLLATPGEILSSGALRFTNEGKYVVLGRPGTPECDLTLAVNGGNEYGRHTRTNGEPWVHLLVEQPIADSPPLAAMSRARFHAEVRLLKCDRLPMDGYSPSLHAAQAQLYFVLQNTNPKSPGRGHLVWFGIPFFDDRERVPKLFQARDSGKPDASGMFIYLADGRDFGGQSLHDKQWVVFDRDLLPLMLDSLRAAKSRGFLNGSTDPADFQITSVNLGWELPGRFDAALQLRDLSLRLENSPPAPPSR